MPNALPELDAQYRLIREECGLLRRDDLAVISVRGAEGAEFLQGQLTNDVEALQDGDGCYAALLDRKGKVQADARVLRVSGEELLLIAEAELAPLLARHLGTYNIGRDAAVAVEEDLLIITLAGPRAEEIVGAPLGALENHFAIELGKADARVVSTWVGADLIVAAEDGDQAIEKLRAAGAEDVAAEAIEIARVEAGIPRAGKEVDESTIPQEAGLNERAVSFTKGCYIGQETVARLHYKGKPNRHLRRLLLSEHVTDGAPIFAGEKQVGVVGTAVISPARGPLALAVVRREAEPGTEVSVGEGVTATVEAVNEDSGGGDPV